MDNEKKFPNRIDKALAWLTDSRNGWKEKCMKTKLQLKRQSFAIKRAKDGRNSWKLLSATLKQELIQCEKKTLLLQQRVDELESQVENYEKEIQVVKKKQ